MDWADPEKEVDEETMQRVKVLYVRNLMISTTEETIKAEFNNTSDTCAGRKLEKSQIREYSILCY